MADVKWIKLSTDIFEDEKIDFIQSLPEGDSLILIWIRLLALAGKRNADGFVFLTEDIPYTDDALAHKFKMQVNVIKLAMKTFQNLNMIELSDKGIELLNWGKYQSLEGFDKIKEKEKARVRKQRQRDKVKEIEGGNSEIELSRDSHGNVTGTPSIIDIDKDKEEDKELERDKELELELELERDIEDKGCTSYQQEIVDNFNNMCKTLPKVTRLNENRKNLISKSMDKFKDIKVFFHVFKKANESDFLSGRNEKWQGCSFDWLISEENMLKTLEGNYDKRKGMGQVDTFNNYEQRVYDYDVLEKKLLGWDTGDG